MTKVEIVNSISSKTGLDKKEVLSIVEAFMLCVKESMANGCAYSALTIVNLKEMQTNKIPFVLQQQFAEKIEKTEQQKKLISQSIKEVEDLFNSRMNYYFN